MASTLERGKKREKRWESPHPGVGWVEKESWDVIVYTY